MLVISSFKFSIFKARFLFVITAFRLNPTFKNSSLVIQLKLLILRFSTEVMLSNKWCAMLFIVILLSDAILFRSLGLICSSVKHLSDKITARKVSKYGVISGLYFPVFGLNTESYDVNLRIQSEYREIRTRNNSIFGHFSRSVIAVIFP